MALAVEEALRRGIVLPSLLQEGRVGAMRQSSGGGWLVEKAVWCVAVNGGSEADGRGGDSSPPLPRKKV